MENALSSTLFSMVYLAIIWFILIKLLSDNLQTDMLQKRDATWKWTFTAYFLLGFGDLFHLGARIFLFFSPMRSNTPFAELVTGWGLIITGITMTYFYVALLHAWKSQYAETYYTKQKVKKFFLISYSAFVARILLMALPYNQWFGSDPSFDLGVKFRIITSIPLYLVGLLTIYLLLKTSLLEKAHPSGTIKSPQNEGNYKAALSYLFSYIMYSITLFLVDTYPLAGLFMIPKTVAYLVALYYHYTTLLTGDISTG